LSAAELSLRQTEEQIASQTEVAYDAILVAASQLDNDRESEKLSEDVLRKTQARFDAGTVARLDVLQARVNFSQARNQTIADERALTNAHATLNRLLARPTGSPVEPDETLGVPPSPAELAALLALAAECRPDLASIRAQREGARFAIKLAHEFWFPDLNVSLFRNFTVGSPDSYSTAGSIALPLFFWQHEGRRRRRRGSPDGARGRRGHSVAGELDVRTAWTPPRPPAPGGLDT
jgi:outer membrane protein TolC